MESLMKEWLIEGYCKRWENFFSQIKALFVLKAAIMRTNSTPAEILRGTTKYVEPLNVSINCEFKAALRVE